MKLVLEADHQWDLLGDEYMNSEKVVFSFKDNGDYVALKMTKHKFSFEPDGKFFIKKAELITLLAALKGE